ncbi:hypothetical protein BX616_005219 [Lobosporangium transversale]|uniref:Histone chaperone domain-containing protein n=1 Tax=Lobosporangium transversale TaxID=64571 RepID=A0A1Y2GJ29_9FUNG|nr:hypothetical protein BCR41DRAFT_356151 [Lobosporangium transversale]KAF9915846.1 hypothetical protein BX616_005219 [Lobosporangium transversale]ORZ12481.1 hypothetical protein BCR41DRAFT_356151 [Lobosporangium transversale]|eukprot:XP_021880100.1 hypothetical protein BCR41DRAFT_356151 [Lobosporangium transversale]
MSDSPAEKSSLAAGKRKAEEAIEPASVKRAVASSSSTKLNDLDDSAQEDDDLDEDLDFLETSNIIHSGRRTRGVKIDFSKVPQDDLDEDDDDDDDDDAAVAPGVEENDDDEEEEEVEYEEEEEEENEQQPTEEAQKPSKTPSPSSAAGEDEESKSDETKATD